VSPESNASSR